VYKVVLTRYDLGLLAPAAPVEAGVDIDVPGVSLLAAPAGVSTDADVESGLGRGELLGEETAVGSVSDARLLKVGGLELGASTLVHAEHGKEHAEEARLLVDSVLGLSVGSAERGVERTGESLLAHAVARLVNELAATVGGLAAVRRRRRRVCALVVTVGASDDNLVAIAVLTTVGSSVLGDVLSPDAALVVDKSLRIVARALLGVPGRVALNVDVEASAGLGVVAELGAGVDVVAAEELVGKVTGASGGTLEVHERLLVASRSLSILGLVLVVLVGNERLGSVGDLGVVSDLGLRSAGVERVDEAAVSANLDVGGASRVSGESPGVGPVDGSAAGRGGGVASVGCGRSGGDWASRSWGNSWSRRLRGCLLEAPWPKGALFEAPLDCLCRGNTSGGSSSHGLSSSLLVGSDRAGTNTDGRALSKDGGSSIQCLRVEGLRGRRGSDKSDSSENDGVTHSE
jgi:hypothetical protein